MRKLLVFLTFVTFGAAVLTGLWQQKDERIVGGTTTTIKTAPWQVSIMRHGAHFCGGTIYSETIIITTAQCLQLATALTLRVRAGSSYWNSGGVILNVESFLQHEGLSLTTKANDIGLIRLSSPLTFGPTIQSIQLAEVAPANGATASFTGWGTRDKNAGSIPTQLHKVDLTIIRRTECASSSYGHGSDIKSSMICANGAEKDACQSDTGGPLVSGEFLVGIFSWNIECNLERYPSVFADVAVLKPWIEEASTRV